MNFSCDTMNGVVGAPGQGVFKNRVAADNLCGVDCYAMGATPACVGHFTGYVDARLHPCPSLTQCETTQVTGLGAEMRTCYGSGQSNCPSGYTCQDMYCCSPSCAQSGNICSTFNTSGPCAPVSANPVTHHHHHKKHPHKKHRHGHPSILTHKKHHPSPPHPSPPSYTPPSAECLASVEQKYRSLRRPTLVMMPGSTAQDVCEPQGPRSGPTSGWYFSNGYCVNGGNIYGYTNPDLTEAFNLCVTPMPKVTQLFASYGD